MSDFKAKMHQIRFLSQNTILYTGSVLTNYLHRPIEDAHVFKAYTHNSFSYAANQMERGSFVWQ